MAARDIIEHQFKKGQSGNPAGGVKGPRLSTILRDMLEASTPAEIAKAKFMAEFYTGRKKPTSGHAVIARLLKAGIIDGESWAIKEILDRTEGKAVQGLEIGNKDGEPFQQQVIFKRAINPNDTDGCDTDN
jgi:hypothetical protein